MKSSTDWSPPRTGRSSRRHTLRVRAADALRPTVKVSALALYSIIVPSGSATRMEDPFGDAVTTLFNMMVFENTPSDGRIGGGAAVKVDAIDGVRRTGDTAGCQDRVGRRGNRPRIVPERHLHRRLRLEGIKIVHVEQLGVVGADQQVPAIEGRWPATSGCCRSSGWRSAYRCWCRRPEPGSCPAAPGRSARARVGDDVDQFARNVVELTPLVGIPGIDQNAHRKRQVDRFRTRQYRRGDRGAGLILVTVRVDAYGHTRGGGAPRRETHARPNRTG